MIWFYISQQVYLCLIIELNLKIVFANNITVHIKNSLFLYIVELCSAGDFQKCIFYFSGPNSSPIAGTDTTLTMDENGRAPTHPENWHARLIGQNKTDVTVGVSPPCNCFVGEWSLFISAQSKTADNNVHKEEFECSSDINILLNPWCKGLKLFYFDIHLKHAKLSVLRCYSTL